MPKPTIETTEYKGFTIRKDQSRGDIHIKKGTERATFTACYSVQAAKNIIDTFTKNKYDESGISYLQDA